VGASERVCVYCDVLWLGPKEYVCPVRCYGWVQRVFVFCEMLWVGPKKCVCLM